MRSWIIIALTACTWAGGCPAVPSVVEPPDEDTLVVFHNNSGPMCLDALDWLADVQAAHPSLAIEVRLTHEPGETDRLLKFTTLYGVSQGVSTSFEYLPIIFFRGQAFSGFDAEIAAALEALLATAETPP
jgi:ABC-type glycerol-3-phosphate transport system substrate-binding protein